MPPPSPSDASKRVFIGHGRSPAWESLRDLLSGWSVKTDEYSRVSVAGIGIDDRLETMLEECSFAFLVMTAENPHEDGTLHARDNVIHEVGLFQGRYGARRAIVLLEDGCQRFSNSIGLNHIPFPQDDPVAASTEIRAVLERESIP